jgi:hypothetical protein
MSKPLVVSIPHRHGKEEATRLTVTLPWLLAKFAHAVQGAATKQGTLMLEKK